MIAGCTASQDTEVPDAPAAYRESSVIGGLGLLLGSLVLLVVCSGINDLFDEAPRPGAGGASRLECQW
jgi:hypothetical protein